MKKRSRNDMRLIRHSRLRRSVSGTAERPRLSVFRSLGNIYAQVIDDEKGHTLLSASSQDKELKGSLSAGTGNVDAAKAVGKLLAERAKSQGISKVVFDRGGHKFHGRVAALAEAAREAGLEF